jgi:hypothetical protein
MIATVAFANGAVAQEPDARALLSRMSAEIAALESFIVEGDAYADARLSAGQIIEHASHVTLRVRRPAMMRITKRVSEHTTDVFFGGGQLSVYNDENNYYAQAQLTEEIAAAAEFALDEIGIEAPFLDFVSANISDNLLQDAEQVRHLGTSLIRGDIFDHIAIRTPEIDIQIWIASEGRPLPGKMAISSKWEGGSPRFVAFLNWDTDPSIPADTFRFVPPQGATEIEFVPVP